MTSPNSTPTQGVGQHLEVVVTALVPEGEERPWDRQLIAAAIKQAIRQAQPNGVIYDGRGPASAYWIVGSYQRSVDGGFWRFVINVWEPTGQTHQAVAVGAASDALRSCLCALEITPCGER